MHWFRRGFAVKNASAGVCVTEQSPSAAATSLLPSLCHVQLLHIPTPYLFPSLSYIIACITKLHYLARHHRLRRHHYRCCRYIQCFTLSRLTFLGSLGFVDCSALKEPQQNCFAVMFFFGSHRLAGVVVKASASGVEDPVFDSRLRRNFSGSSHTSDFKIGTPVAILPGAWHDRVSAGTGRPGVSLL